MSTFPADIVVVGSGAAGLMAAIQAARAGAAVIALDGARRLGAKILVAGGGRCNVTHERVNETDYAGSTPPAIRKVLRRFDVPETIDFFSTLGVTLKREETGKLFPVTDKAGTVLDALLRASRDAGVTLLHPWRVGAIEHDGDGFVIHASMPPRGAQDDPAAEVPAPEPLRARRVIMATGGKSLPKTGSDGAGYGIVRSLGHTLTPNLFPGLVPLTLPRGHRLCSLSGIATPATLTLRSASGKVLKSFTGSTLITHTGLSGPCVLDMSRYWTMARIDSPATPPTLSVNWLVGMTPEAFDDTLRGLGRVTLVRTLTQQIPERLARLLCEIAQVDPATPGHALTREQRKALVNETTNAQLPIEGDRGYLFAEVTAGGVPLSEVNLATMESRVCPGLHLCGEICDVDGRIGGFNFQWAWASGYVAGTSAARMLAESAARG
ncbi:MAG: NAD(P)/FAD-dependent oxidoreductase [Phycisphaerales bacterium]|nr:NAD(P)/FAD-dependent oxidoreductase [Phycisphaerales bacterium]